MNSRKIFFSLHDQPVRREAVKALMFHGIGLFLVVIGIIAQNVALHLPFVDKINFCYWVLLCMVPISEITITEKKYSYEGEEFKKLAKTLNRWSIFRKIPPFFWRLRDFRVIRTFGSFYRDLSDTIQFIFFMIIVYGFNCLGMIFVLHYSRFPVLWVMGAFFVAMLCRYAVILSGLRTASIVINDDAIIMPLFRMKKMHTVSIPWLSVTHLEIIGSEGRLYTDYSSLNEAIAFMSGVIIHYTYKYKYLWKFERTRQEMCVITDQLLDTENLWKLYNYSNNYVGQRDIKLRLKYGYRLSSKHVQVEDATSLSMALSAEKRFAFSLSKIESPVKSRPVRSRLLVIKRHKEQTAE